VILSDGSIREALDDGSIVIDPLLEGGIQPSSVDLRVDRFFRVFRNDTTPYIDPKQAQEDLTELVEVADGGAFILHPGEFVLGSTLERVKLPNDVVARLEGKSSLGRLGLLIHSSLPASEPVMLMTADGLRPRAIGEIVRDQVEGSVVSFDPDTFEVGYHEITGWYEGPPDRIYEIRLASGRRVRVTAGHNLFTLDENGELAKTRTLALRDGARVAIPAVFPEPPAPSLTLDVLPLIPDEDYGRLMCTGPTLAAAFVAHEQEIRESMMRLGIRHFDYYRSRARLPFRVAEGIDGLLQSLGTDDLISVRQGKDEMPRFLRVSSDFAWLIGLYVAEGSRRDKQFTVSNTDLDILDRTEGILQRLGVSTYRSEGRSITGCSALFSLLFKWMGTGIGAHHKRVPPLVHGWPWARVHEFLDGLIDGDGSRDRERQSVWTSSEGLAGDVLLLAERLGLRAGSSKRERDGRPLWQVYMPRREHKLLTSVPLPDRLLVEVRKQAGLTQADASRDAGFKHPTDLCNIENRTGRDAVRLATLRRIRSVYERRSECVSLPRLDRLVDGHLRWDRVVEVRDTGTTEPIFDLEVKPGGRKIENFLAGNGGVFVSNTAGFVDAGWDGHLTLELSNVANLPIAIYPGMRIGQISFLEMTAEAETPYGSETTGSKYQGQRGPTPSRYYLNFEGEEPE
jgi:dCTP deaminase